MFPGKLMVQAVKGECFCYLGAACRVIEFDLFPRSLSFDFCFMGAHIVTMKIAPLHAAKVLMNEGYSNSAATVITALLSESIHDDIDLDDLAAVPSRFAEYRTKKDAVSAHGPDVKIACGVERECVIVDLDPAVAVA